MQNRIKQIREYMQLSQQQLADRLDVSFATINRWENGRALPNKLAQSKLFEFCSKHAVPVYDMLLAEIKETADSITLNSNRLLLYHGSKTGIVGKIEPKSRNKCDFGKGFYMGTNPEQPLTLVCDFKKSRFYIVSVDMDSVKSFDVPANIEWAMLVAYHRDKMERIKGTALYRKYNALSVGNDIIIGSIANDRMFYVLDSFFLGNITDTALVKSLSALQLGRQYVAITEHGCDAVRIEKEIPLSHLDRLCLKVVAEENRTKGVSLANEICKNYRREGKYYDEILDDAMKGAR